MLFVGILPDGNAVDLKACSFRLRYLECLQYVISGRAVLFQAQNRPLLEICKSEYSEACLAHHNGLFYHRKLDRQASAREPMSISMPGARSLISLQV